MITRLLDLTQATLQEWAMKQGIDADVASMTQAEKTMLRYQYVMNNAKLSMGDFAKTADTWANVVKTLKQQFQALGGTIGTVFINAFKPALIALRNFMQHVLDFAKTVADALGAIFGWTIEVTVSGSTIADDLGSAADSIGDVGSGADGASDGLGNAAGNAKKLAKNLSVLPFDELNQLSKAAESSGGGGSNGGSNGGSSGGGGGGMSGSGANAALVRTESVLEKITSDIGSLAELGAYISKALTDAMNSIPWEEIYEKARGFGTGLAEFLNALITPDLFGALGKTIAGAINVAIEGVGGFVDNFNWDNLGISIGTGINKFFEELHWQRAGMNINKIGKGILKAIGKVLEKVDWDQVGTDIATFLSSIEIDEIIDELVKVIGKAVDAAIKVLEAMWRTAPVETTLFLAFNAIKILGLATLLKTAIIKHVAAYLSPATIAASIKSALFPANTIAMSGPLTLSGLSVTITNLAMGVSNSLLATNPAAIGAIGSWICDKISGFIDEHLGDNVSEAIGNVLMSMTGAAIGTMIAPGIGTLVGAVAGLIVAEFANPVFSKKVQGAIVGLFGDLSVAAEDIAAGFGIIASSIKQAVLEGLKGLVDDLPEPLKKILGLEGASVWLQLKIDAEIEKQTDLRKEQDKHLPETGDVNEAVDKTGGNTRIAAAAAIDKADNKIGYKPNIESTAKFNEAYNGLSTGQRTFNSSANFTSRTNGLTTAQRTFGSVANFVTRLMGLSGQQRTFSSTANFVARLMGLSSKQRTFSSTANFVSRLLGLSKSEKTINTVADFVSRVVDLTSDEKTISTKANFNDSKDNLSTPERTLDAIANFIRSTSNKIFGGYNGGVFQNGDWKPITSFASGGYAYGGQIFRARENGNPELVGTLKGSTAVMNNNQIVASVSDGVARAIAGIRFQMTGFKPPEVDVNNLQNVIEYAVVSALANNATERPIQNYVTVKMPNGEVLARAVDDGHRTINYRESAVAT